MTITASAAQIGAQPVQQSTLSSTIFADILSQSATIGTARVSSAERIVFAPSLFGTLTADCTAVVEVSVNGSSFCPIATWTNAELQANTAKVVEVTANMTFRTRLLPGTMTGSNGINLRYKN